MPIGRSVCESLRYLCRYSVPFNENSVRAKLVILRISIPLFEEFVARSIRAEVSAFVSDVESALTDPDASVRDRCILSNQPTPSLIRANHLILANTTDMTFVLTHQFHHSTNSVPSSLHHPSSGRSILPHNLPHSLFIRGAVLLEQIIRVRLRRALWVHLVQQHLDPEQDLFDRDGGFPAFFFVQDAQADGA
jgi:hypothetical protein